MSRLRLLVLGRRCDDRGALAPAVPIIAFMLLLLGGLGIDGSRQLNARGQAVAYAEEAARAGAQGVSPGGNVLILDEAKARERVRTYCAEVLRRESVTRCQFAGVENSREEGRPLIVVTEVELNTDTTLLKMVGITSFTASGDGRARPYEGIDQIYIDPGLEEGQDPTFPDDGAPGEDDPLPDEPPAPAP